MPKSIDAKIKGRDIDTIFMQKGRVGEYFISQWIFLKCRTPSGRTNDNAETRMRNLKPRNGAARASSQLHSSEFELLLPQRETYESLECRCTIIMAIVWKGM